MAEAGRCCSSSLTQLSTLCIYEGCTCLYEERRIFMSTGSTVMRLGGEWGANACMRGAPRAGRGEAHLHEYGGHRNGGGSRAHMPVREGGGGERWKVIPANVIRAWRGGPTNPEGLSRTVQAGTGAN